MLPTSTLANFKYSKIQTPSLWIPFLNKLLHQWKYNGVYFISATYGNKRRNLMGNKILYYRSLPSVTYIPGIRPSVDALKNQWLAKSWARRFGVKNIPFSFALTKTWFKIFEINLSSGFHCDTSAMLVCQQFNKMTTLVNLQILNPSMSKTRKKVCKPKKCVYSYFRYAYLQFCNI